MGENKHIKELDAFAKKYIKEIDSEKTSSDFAVSLMDRISNIKAVTLPKTTPLISKKSWVVICTIVITIICFSFQSSKASIINLPNLNFSFLDKIQVPNFMENLSISNTTFYAFLFFGLMIIIQFTYLKSYFHKKIN